MTALRLIDGDGQKDRVSHAAVRLDLRSRRPGVAHEELELHLGSYATIAFAGAAHDRLPTPLWSLITIESERALHAVASSEPARCELAAHLDWAARAPMREVSRKTRLHTWASSLRRPLDPAHHATLVPGVTLNLIVPYHTLLAWELAADVAGLTLLDWARSLLTSAGRGRARWEAAAAEAGCTLSEWVALFALTSPSGR
jgi:hypothetical protein